MRVEVVEASPELERDTIAAIPSEVYDLLPGPRLAFYAAGFILPAMGAFAVLRKKLQPRPRFPFIGGSHTEV